jgi:ribonuclease P protein component
MNEKFGKEYKLCSQKLIESIFDKKQGVKSYPFILHYKELTLPVNNSFQVVLSVPKRNFKKAHDRNKIKRQIKEIIRKNKSILEALLEKQGQQYGLFLIFTGREALDFGLMTKKIIQLIEKFSSEITTKNVTPLS